MNVCAAVRTVAMFALVGFVSAGWIVGAVTLLPTRVAFVDCTPNLTGIYPKFCTDRNWPTVRITNGF